MLAAVVSGVIVCIICLMFGILVYFKIQNSKKNASNQPNGTSPWTLQQLNSLHASEDHAKSSVSTYISNDLPFYDRSNMTGQSDVCDSEFSQLIAFNPPPSPVTERAMSTMSAARSTAMYSEYNDCARCDLCHGEIMDEDGMVGGHDAPPPTIVSELDDDLYFSLKQTTNDWTQKSTICGDCQSTASHTQTKEQNNGRIHNGSVGMRRPHRGLHSI